MPTDREWRIAEYESERNDAMDRWFNARKDVVRDAESERVFEGGFRIAWEYHNGGGDE